MNNKSWREKFRKKWKEDGMLCLARHYETYNGGETFEQCIVCRDYYENLISQTIEQELAKAVEECVPSHREIAQEECFDNTDNEWRKEGFNECRLETLSNFQQYIKKIK